METRKRKKHSAFLLALVITLSVGLTGCGGPENLAQYVSENEDVYNMIQEQKEQSENVGMMETDISVEGNTLSYIYTYKETYPANQTSQIKTSLEAYEDTLESGFEPIKDTLEEGSGLDVTVKIIYNNGDGSEIVSFEI